MFSKKVLTIALFLGFIQVNQAIRVRLSDEDEGESSQPDVIDDSDVVIQIYDSNKENFDELTAPTANNEPDDFIQTKAEIKFRPNPAQSPWAIDPADAPSNDITGAFTVGDNDSSYYSRQIPDTSDDLMKSVYTNYAIEGRGADGNPNGQFFVTRSDMQSLVDEVLTNNMGFSDSVKKQDYSDAHFPHTWDHFDLFNKGYLPVNEVPQFLRLIVGEVEVQNSLQLQLEAQNINTLTLERPIDKVVLQFRPDPSQSPWAAKKGDDAPKSAIHNAFKPDSQGVEHYERKVPDQFNSQDNDDLLMRSVINTYALEGRGDDGQPTGKFYLDLPQLYKVGEEVVRTHIGYTGSKNQAYLDQYLPKIFNHIDILKKGYILAEEGPEALRLLLDEVHLENGLQVQIGESIAWRPNPILSPFAAKLDSPLSAEKLGFSADYEKNNIDYQREVPDKYKDDKLMNSIISKYAWEGRNADGQKSGSFYMTKDLTKDVATEVVETHMHKTGADRDSYIEQGLNKLWDHYDVNHEGVVDAQRIPPMLRQLVGEVEATIGLQ